MKSDVNKVNVLWTGGYDSSFRMVQLSKKDVTIQPYYLSVNRISEKNELNAIAEITDDINKNEETKCKILPLKIYNVSDVKEDKEITEAHLNLRKHSPLSAQYSWLRMFAKDHNIEGLELTIEKSGNNNNIAYESIKKFGATKLINNSVISYHIIDENKSSKDLIKIFGKFHFPNPSFMLTKKETLDEYKRLGFEDTVSKTWFCYNPINNEPCGLCNPCKSTIVEGMEFRFPESSLRRYKFRFFYNNINRLKNGLSRRFKKTLSK